MGQTAPSLKEPSAGLVWFSADGSLRDGAVCPVPCRYIWAAPNLLTVASNHATVIAMVFACRWGNIPSSCLLSFNLLLKYFGFPEVIALKAVMIVANAVSWFTLRLPACLTSTSVGVSRPSPDFNLRILFWITWIFLLSSFVNVENLRCSSSYNSDKLIVSSIHWEKYYQPATGLSSEAAQAWYEWPPVSNYSCQYHQFRSSFLLSSSWCICQDLPN